MNASTLAFATPAFLAGLVAVAVPVVVHLLSKRRARPVPFALITLLLQSQKQTARTIRLRHLLLLAVRTLLVAAIAVAIAQPYMQRATSKTADATAEHAVVIVIDNTASMSAQAGGRSLLARAKDVAMDEIRKRKTDVRVAAISCAANITESGTPSFDRSVVLNFIERLTPSLSTQTLAPCVAQATRMLLGIDGAGKRLVIISDMAKHAFADEKSALPAAAGVAVTWQEVRMQSGDNWGVVDARAERTMARTGSGIRVVAAVQGSSVDGTLQPAAMDLLRGDVRLARTQTPNKSTTADVPFFVDATAASPSTETGVRDDLPLDIVIAQDPWRYDDVLSLPFASEQALQVVIVDGAPQAVPFLDEVYYFDHALTTIRGGRGRLQTRIVGPDAFAALDLAEARVVVLANVKRLLPDVESALVAFVRAGGGLLVTAGDQLDAGWMNQALAPLLPALLRGEKRQALLEDAALNDALSLETAAPEHPALLRLKRAGADETLGLSRSRTHTSMLVEPAADDTVQTLLRFSNGAPALLERQVGNGKVFMLLTSMDRDWSDLAIRPGFVPLMQQLTLYLGGVLEDGASPLSVVGAPRAIALERGVVEVEVKSADATHVYAATADAEQVLVTHTDVPGLHRVSMRMEGGAFVRRPAQDFSVRVDARESDITPVSQADRAVALPPGAHETSNDDDSDKRPLWPFVLLCLAALLAVEAAVLRKTTA